MFNCTKLDAALAKGTRIEIDVPIRTPTDYAYEYNIVKIPMPATIIVSKGNKFACVIDRDAMAQAIEDYADVDEEKEHDVDKFRFRKFMRHSKIKRFLDEPKSTICSIGKVKLKSGACDRKPGEECDCERMRKDSELLVVNNA